MDLLNYTKYLLSKQNVGELDTHNPGINDMSR